MNHYIKSHNVTMPHRVGYVYPLYKMNDTVTSIKTPDVLKTRQESFVGRSGVAHKFFRRDRHVIMSRVASVFLTGFRYGFTTH